MKKFLLFLIIVFIAYLTAFYTTGKKNGYTEMFNFDHLAIFDNDTEEYYESDDYIQNGFNYIEEGRYEEAIEEFFFALYEDDNSINNYYVGYGYLLSEDYMSAVAYLNTSINLDSKNEEAYLARGMAKYYQTYYDEAIKDLFFTTELNHENAEAYYYLSLCYAAQGNHPVALQSAESAVKYDSLYKKAWFKAGYIALDVEDFEKSKSYYKTLLEIDSAYQYANLNLGLAYANTNDDDSAIYYYDKSIELYPDYYLAYNNKAYIFQKNEDYNEAVKWYNKSVNQSNNETRPLWNRADCYYELKKYKEAIDDYLNVYDINNEYYNTLFYSGKCYEAMNDSVNALRYYKKFKEKATTENEYYEAATKKISELFLYEMLLLLDEQQN